MGEEGIEFYYDGAKFSLKLDKVLDKTAIIIEREKAYLFSIYTITCDKKDFAKFDSFITTSIKFYLHFYDDDMKQEANKIKDNVIIIKRFIAIFYSFGFTK